VFCLWRDQRKVQLILSDELIREYLEVLDRLNVGSPKIARLSERFKRRESITVVNLGARAMASRDPDNFVLATAAAGKAEFLVTNDRDLLDMPAINASNSSSRSSRLGNS
jgi:putative PIN family toxin of toxin-antitoxin system